MNLVILVVLIVLHIFARAGRQAIKPQNHTMSQKDAERICSSKTLAKIRTDPFDELPDDILLSIISSYFTVKDVAIASLLSRRWRHLCASMSKLKFNWETMFCRTIEDRDSWRNDDNVHHLCQEYKDRFVRVVNQFVQRHDKDGSRLDLFSLGLCLDRDSTCDIDHWVSFAISMAVKELDLCLSCSIRDMNLYILRSELLCHRNVAKIRSLILCSCIVGRGVMDRLSFLKSLKLAHMPLGQEGFENILSSCLSLECLVFYCVKLPLKLCVSGSPPRLKCIAVLYCLETKEIELSSLASLTSFEYAGPMIKFSFLGVPNLEKVYFRPQDIECLHYVFSRLAEDLPSVKTLSVLPEREHDWILHLPQNMATFNKIKLLKVFYKQTENLDLLRMMIGLRGCPLLEKFHLRINCPVQFEQGTNEPTESFYKHLKEFHIGGFVYNIYFAEFLVYVLDCAISLEEMIIDPKLKIYIGGGRYDSYNRNWLIGQRQELCRRLQGHSKSAVVVVR